MRQSIPTIEPATIASSLFGIAQNHWARGEHTEAISNAERALALQEVAVPQNETNVATTLSLLGHIYQDSGDTTRALDVRTRALIIFEGTMPPDSPILAELLYNLGLLQLRSEALADAQKSLDRSVKIYRKILPKVHADRMVAENELRRVVQLRQKNKENSAQQ